jgi:hypothetical protein
MLIVTGEAVLPRHKFDRLFFQMPCGLPGKMVSFKKARSRGPGNTGGSRCAAYMGRYVRVSAVATS